MHKHGTQNVQGQIPYNLKMKISRWPRSELPKQAISSTHYNVCTVQSQG